MAFVHGQTNTLRAQFTEQLSKNHPELLPERCEQPSTEQTSGGENQSVTPSSTGLQQQLSILHDKVELLKLEVDVRWNESELAYEAFHKRTEQLASQLEQVSNDIVAVQVLLTTLSKDMERLSMKLIGLSKTMITRGNVLASLVDEVEGLSKEQMMSQPGKINVSLLYEPLGQEKLRHFLEKVIH